LDLDTSEPSPRPAVRDGMKQESYEFHSRPARMGSKDEATYGVFRKHAFLAS
jgi:hypothetical protein